ncbi:ubiquitin carboxyl-terminal hydrolase 8 [Asparagus officinalis]|uniref:ubiquitin carboxyl-terminal hydrolase 8 n=1 Tax=Asparagus officinalis TaxID=4686 RepID=UPI00098E5A57|nr:ubiquitin carboxyl-terminal hydrolase 8 [Asparagus officinalis]
MDGTALEIAGGSAAASAASDDDGRVFLVPYRWWRESQESGPDDGAGGVRGILYSASPGGSPSYGMKIISNIFSSDLVFNLRKDDDLMQNGESEDGVGVSGRSYALIPSDLWSKALKWHNDAASNARSSFSWEDGLAEVYPLMLRITVLRETNVMNVKISKKDNAVENYKRACKIFSVDSEMVRIWDFSGQTDLIFMNEWNRHTRDGPRQADQEILLELQVYLLSDSLNHRIESQKDDLTVQQSKMTSYGGSLLMNGNIGNSDFRSSGSSKRFGSYGLTGLDNLGNTCFMNSAIQCLAHTPMLVEYFLGDYSREINPHNPLGMNGELALAFGELLRKLWAPDRAPVVPRVFKAKLARFAPQFSGFNQHDSQELLAFLLDGLHEDLNRVKCKPYTEVKDSCGRPDEQVADEYWSNHLARNDSIIVDVCQGQYKSTLVCPVCSKVSVTFDPFMYLSLPLPSSASRTMTITIFSSDGTSAPSSYTINVPKYGKCKDLMQALSVACSLRDNESLLVAEIYGNRIIRYLEDPSDAVSLIRDGDRLAAYKLLKDDENYPLVVFTHQRVERYIHSIMSSKKAFGVPLVARLSVAANGSTIRDLYLKLLNPFLRSSDAISDLDHSNINVGEFAKVESSNGPENEGIAEAAEVGDCVQDEFQFYITDEKCQAMHSKIDMDESTSLTGLQKQLHVIVCWQEKAPEKYDIELLNSLPEIYKSALFSKRPQEPISLYSCLEAFLKEEPLGPEDMWYCPSCKEHRQACKKLDLWRLPEILVIHLKRFSYSRFLKNKLETFVDFPIDDLELSDYIAYKTQQPSHRYRLYAISNHYGSMGGGHYTAYVHHEGANRWYDFDDRHVNPLSDETSIKSSAAYVLFYQRVQAEDSDSRSTTSTRNSPDHIIEAD